MKTPHIREPNQNRTPSVAIILAVLKMLGSCLLRATAECFARPSYGLCVWLFVCHTLQTYQNLYCGMPQNSSFLWQSVVPLN